MNEPIAIAPAASHARSGNRLPRLLAWYRALPSNPVYRRERGDWGQPNSLYRAVTRYSPFVVLGALVFGACGSYSNIALFNNVDAIFMVYCLLCLPGMVLSMLTLYGSIMAPALTAPSINVERTSGSWEILLATPQSYRSIIGAKLFGALSRLGIWKLIFGLSLLQSVMTGLVYIMFSGTGLAGLILVPLTFVRPYLDIFVAALLGLTFSVRLRSATGALAATYGVLLVVKMLTGSGIWNLALGAAMPFSGATTWLITLVPIIFIGITILACLAIISRPYQPEA